jgi:hypothetical protein
MGYVTQPGPLTQALHRRLVRPPSQSLTHSDERMLKRERSWTGPRRSPTATLHPHTFAPGKRASCNTGARSPSTNPERSVPPPGLTRPPKIKNGRSSSRSRAAAPLCGSRASATSRCWRGSSRWAGVIVGVHIPEPRGVCGRITRLSMSWWLASAGRLGPAGGGRARGAAARTACARRQGRAGAGALLAGGRAWLGAAAGGWPLSWGGRICALGEALAQA